MRGPKLADLGVVVLAVVVLGAAGYAVRHRAGPVAAAGSAVLQAGALTGTSASGAADATPVSSSPAAPPAPAVTMTNPHLLVIGDSLAAGYDATEPARGFPQLVASALRTTEPVSETLRAIPSGTVHQLSLDTTIPSGIGLTILELGTADIGITRLHTFNVEYRELVARVRAADPGAGLICLGTWYDPTTAAAWDTRIQADCAGSNSAYVPLSPLYAAPGTHGPKGGPTFLGRPSDAFHPTDLGHADIARAVLAELGVPASAVPAPSPAAAISASP